MSNKHVISDLYQMQSLPLNAKISMTQRRIREWVDEYGEDGVYISFSGGKDSTVLLNIARKLYPNIRAVFVDTGLEYPEIRAFVKGFDNVDWIRPKLTFREVIGKYMTKLFRQSSRSNRLETSKRILFRAMSRM